MKTNKEISYIKKLRVLWKVGYDLMEAALLAKKIQKKELAAIRKVRRQQIKEKEAV